MFESFLEITNYFIFMIPNWFAFLLSLSIGISFLVIYGYVEGFLSDNKEILEAFPQYIKENLKIFIYCSVCLSFPVLFIKSLLLLWFIIVLIFTLICIVRILLKVKFISSQDTITLHKGFVFVGAISILYSVYCLLGFNIDIDTAYKYIINNPYKYVNYVSTLYDKKMKYYRDCLDDTNCLFIQRELESNRRDHNFKSLSKAAQNDFIYDRILTLQQMCRDTINSREPYEFYIDYKIENLIKEGY